MVAGPAVSVRAAVPTDLRPVRVVLLSVGLLLLPFSVELVRLTQDPIQYYAFIVFLFDIPLAALALAFAPSFARRIAAGRGRMTTLWLAFAALLLLSFVVHPSASGAQALMRILVGLAVAVAIMTLDLDHERTIVAASLVVASAVQGILMSLQAIQLEPLGLAWLGEYSDPLPLRDGVVVPRGTTGYGYIATAVALLACGLAVTRAAASARPVPWLVAAALAAVPIGLTFSRAAALGLVVGCLWLSWEATRGRRIYALAVVALTVGVAVPAVIRLDGWSAMGAETLQGEPERVSMMDTSLDVIRQEPLFGVGPGRYVQALRGEVVLPSGSRPDLRHPVHNVPLLIAAEAGLAAGATVIALIVVGAARALGARGAAPALFAFFLPYVLVDHFPYAHAQGVVLTGIWIGALALEHRLARGDAGTAR